MNQNSACYAGAINEQGILGTWVLDGAVLSNLSLSMDINSDLPIGRIGVKMVNATDGTVFEISDAQGDYSGAGQWQTLTLNISSGASSGDNINIDQIVIFADWRCDGTPPRPSDLTLLIDNITCGANKLTDPPAPSCTNGIEDGDETGVDCGGSCPNTCIPDPPTSAPQYGSLGTDLYVYSDIVGPSVSNFIFTSFGGAGGTYSEVDLEMHNNMTGKLLDLDFFGSQWDPVDATPYIYVHLDYFATTATNFEFFLIDDSLSETVCCGNPAEPFYAFGPTGDEPLVQGQWTSVFIPLAHYNTFNAGWDGADLKQTKFTGNGTIYFDNIYFSTENSLGVNEFTSTTFKVFPNPTKDNWEIVASGNIITKLELYDILGKNIKSIAVNTINVSIDAKDLEIGVYFAKVYSGNEVKVIRLVKD
ncbi:T9SS type A sorting domain-containing protein [Winogradskyella sp.]|uniref:T9SS type A sorting domain-containing protein n=1 Tax=Winogradskyella sp. TaxID=1883156 RepID=UPI003F6B8DED